MRFSDVRHQERALSIVRRALASGRTHHAYLFEGPEGVGKELAARALAARMLCESGDESTDGEACGACRSCQLFASGNHPDFHLIHRGLHKHHPERNIRAGKGLFLVVDVIRHFLIEPASTTPNLGRRRVFLIRDAERMNEGAQNALLKTLEEPPGQCRLILVTSSAERLLPTIRSRCQRIPFDLLPTAFVQEQISAMGDASVDEARTLASLAQGRLGAALRWRRLGLPAALMQVSNELAAGRAALPEAFAKNMLEIAGELAVQAAEDTANFAEEPFDADQSDGRPRSKTTTKTIETDQLRDALKLVLLLIAAILRDALAVVSGGNSSIRALPENVTAVRFLSNTEDVDLLDKCISAVADAERMLDRNVPPQLACENLAVALTGEARG